MMNKPNWNYAPEWANYVAQDEDGTWYWYEDAPEKCPDSWRPQGKYEATQQHWETTLESRP